jgi:propanol-preferring alcohol dehydrogenase
MGMRPIVIDGGAAKRKLSLEMGAESFIDFTEVPNVAEEVKKVANGVGAHGVIVTAYQAYKDAISYIGDRIGGVVVCVALRECFHSSQMMKLLMLQQRPRI